MKQCSVIVFGDIGRSPRMVNHALAIAENTEYIINVFAYKDNQPPLALLSNPNIHLYDLTSKLVKLLAKMPKQLYLIYALLRIFLQFWTLFLTLLFMKKQQFILVQNPPSIPILLIVYLIKLIRRSKMIVDFHNYGHTILALQIKNRIILKLASSYEHFFGKKSDYALCVSNAMQRDLLLNWKINAVTLYDKANICYYPINSIKDKHQLFKKLNFQWDSEHFPQNETLFTYFEKDQYHFKDNKPALIISSTSWTKDEDFNILVQALDQYDEMTQMADQFSSLFVVITGKGPLKEEFSEIFKGRNAQWQSVRVHLAWLEIEDYPKLLGLADLGICLHYSSSGLDLPMKVVDMFSVGTPVFAKKFKAIDELVVHQQNGVVFENADDLFDYLGLAFKQNSTALQDYRKGVEQFKEITFDVEWRQKMLPYLQRISQQK